MDAFRENFKGPAEEGMTDIEERGTVEADGFETDAADQGDGVEAGAEFAVENDAEEKEEAEEKAKESYREKIESSEAGKNEDSENKEEGGEKQLTPDEMHARYRDAVAKYVQEHERPLVEKVANGIMEAGQFREFRQIRADGILEDLSAILAKMQEGMIIRNAVDLGCGQGEIMRGLMDRLKENNPGIKGICIDKESFVGEDRLGDDTVFVRGDAAETDLTAGSVDFVNVDYLLQALDEEMQKNVLEEVKRLLAEQGHAIIMDVIDRGGREGTVDKIKHKLMNAFAPYNIRTEEGWEKFLEESGFEIEAKSGSGDRSVAFLVRVKREAIAKMADGEE